MRLLALLGCHRRLHIQARVDFVHAERLWKPHPGAVNRAIRRQKGSTGSQHHPPSGMTSADTAEDGHGGDAKNVRARAFDEPASGASSKPPRVQRFAQVAKPRGNLFGLAHVRALWMALFISQLLS